MSPDSSTDAGRAGRSQRRASRAARARTSGLKRAGRTGPWYRGNGAGLQQSWAQVGIDAGVLVILLGLGLLGFHSTFGADPRYLVAGFGGVLLGLGVALASAHWRLNAWATAGLALVVFLLFGFALAAPLESTAGFLPNGESLRVVFTAPVTTWKDILTVAAPVGVRGGMLMAPYLAGMVTALAAGLLAWRLRSPYWTVLPVLVLFALGIMFGTKDAPLPLLRGAALVLVSVAWLAWRRHLLRTRGTQTQEETATLASPAAARRLLVRRLGMGAAMMAVAVLITSLAAPLLTQAEDRKVLRDVVDPPIELFDYPSPLMEFRDYVTDEKDTVLFTVEGLDEGQRVRLAALDAYDGQVFNVDPLEGGNFRPVGDAARVADTEENAQDPRRVQDRLRFTVDAYRGVWLPAGGRLLSLQTEGPRSDELARSLFYSERNETALSTVPLQEGDSYTAEVSYPVVATGEELAEQDFGAVVMPELLNVPQIVPERAQALVGDRSQPWGRVSGLASTLEESGAFSNGGEGEVTSLSGHYAGRITSLLDAEQMIGDDEQYATALVLMARALDIPARVVMGFYPESYAEDGGPVAIKGKDVHAWAEVNIANVGWVALDATPDKDNIPTPPQQEPKSTPKPQVLQPPPPPQEQADLPPDTAPEPQDFEQQERDFWDIWGPLITAILIALIPLLILLIPVLIILWLKARRRRRRRQEDSQDNQVSGGWAEVVSCATDLQVEAPRSSTRREHAAVLSAAFPAAGATTVLARRADAAVFGPEDPSEAQVADYWTLVDSQVADMRASVTGWQRLRGKVSPRSLITESRARRRRLKERRRRDAQAARALKARERERRRSRERDTKALRRQAD